MNQPLPNFLVIGAARCGTTSLVDILRQHPQVFFPYNKETMFFSQDKNYTRGLEWYSRTYYKKSQDYPARGDATPHYLHWSEKTALRILKAYPGKDIKFIVIFRNPVERAYSWYWNIIKEGQEELSFEAALELEEERLRENAQELYTKGLMRYAYYRGGCYVSLLKPYLELFPREQFLFLLLEDLKPKCFDETSQRMMRFLGVDTTRELKPIISNQAGLPRSKLLQRLLRTTSKVKEVLRRPFPLETRHKIKQKLLDLNIRPATYPPMNPETRIRLQQRYADEINLLSTIIDRDLSAWQRSKQE